MTRSEYRELAEFVAAAFDRQREEMRGMLQAFRTEILDETRRVAQVSVEALRTEVLLALGRSPSMRVAVAFPPVLLLVVLLFAGCGSGVVAPEDADPRLQTSVVPGEGWVRVERPGFSFLVPPGFEKTDHQPIDSDAASYVSGTSSLHHDHGWYTGRWSQEEQIDGHPLRDVVRESVRIGGKTAELVAFRYGSVYVVRAWWGRVDRSHGQDVHLLVRGETEDPAVRARLLASLYSVRFD